MSSTVAMRCQSDSMVRGWLRLWTSVSSYKRRTDRLVLRTTRGTVRSSRPREQWVVDRGRSSSDARARTTGGRKQSQTLDARSEAESVPTKQYHVRAMMTSARSSSIPFAELLAPIPFLASRRNAVWQPISNASLTACPPRSQPESFQPATRIVAWQPSVRRVPLKRDSCEMRRT